ncbi:MAG: hypothetical protein EOO41_03790, partial [Methanobacteriota archaeon]
MAHVHIAGIPRITDTTLASLVERAKDSSAWAPLRSLDLSGINELSSSGLVSLLAVAPQLTYLRLVDTYFTDAAFAGCACAGLQLLDVSRRGPEIATAHALESARYPPTHSMRARTQGLGAELGSESMRGVAASGVREAKDEHVPGTSTAAVAYAFAVAAANSSPAWTASGLLWLLHSCSRLRVLLLQNCAHLSEDDLITVFEAAGRHVAVLDVRGCTHVTDRVLRAWSECAVRWRRETDLLTVWHEEDAEKERARARKQAKFAAAVAAVEAGSSTGTALLSSTKPCLASAGAGGGHTRDTGRRRRSVVHDGGPPAAELGALAERVWQDDSPDMQQRWIQLMSLDDELPADDTHADIGATLLAELRDDRGEMSSQAGGGGLAAWEQRPSGKPSSALG